MSVRRKHWAFTVSGDGRVIAAFQGITNAGKAAGHHATSALKSIGVAAGAAGLAVGAAGVAMAAGMLKASAAAAVLRERQLATLAVIEGGANKAKAVFADLNKLSAKPGLNIDSVMDAYLKLRAVNLEAKDAQKLIQGLGNALAMSGQGPEQLGEVAYNLSQIIGKGKVAEEELRDLKQAVPSAATAMQSVFGTADAEKIGAMGLSATQFVKLLSAGLAGLATAPETISNKLTNLSMAWSELKVSLGAGLAGEGGGKFLDALAEALTRLKPLFSAVGAEIAYFIPIITALVNGLGTANMSDSAGSWATSFVNAAATIYTQVSNLHDTFVAMREWLGTVWDGLVATAKLAFNSIGVMADGLGAVIGRSLKRAVLGALDHLLATADTILSHVKLPGGLLAKPFNQEIDKARASIAADRASLQNNGASEKQWQANIDAAKAAMDQIATTWANAKGTADMAWDRHVRAVADAKAETLTNWWRKINAASAPKAGSTAKPATPDLASQVAKLAPADVVSTLVRKMFSGKEVQAAVKDAIDKLERAPLPIRAFGGSTTLHHQITTAERLRKTVISLTSGITADTAALDANTASLDKNSAARAELQRVQDENARATAGFAGKLSAGVAAASGYRQQTVSAQRAEMQAWLGPRLNRAAAQLWRDAQAKAAAEEAAGGTTKTAAERQQRQREIYNQSIGALSFDPEANLASDPTGTRAYFLAVQRKQEQLTADLAAWKQAKDNLSADPNGIIYNPRYRQMFGLPALQPGETPMTLPREQQATLGQVADARIKALEQEQEALTTYTDEAGTMLKRFQGYTAGVIGLGESALQASATIERARHDRLSKTADQQVHEQAQLLAERAQLLRDLRTADPRLAGPQRDRLAEVEGLLRNTYGTRLNTAGVMTFQDFSPGYRNALDNYGRTNQAPPPNISVTVRGNERADRANNSLTDRLTASALGNLGAGDAAILADARIADEAAAIQGAVYTEMSSYTKVIVGAISEGMATAREVAATEAHRAATEQVRAAR